MKRRLTASIALVMSGFVALIPSPLYAHCPLCVGGAGAAAGVAALLGVTYGASGVFIGAFAAAMALWVTKMIKKQFISHQDKILAIVFYFLTIVPLVPFLTDYGSVYVSMGGEYGSLLNSTYLINWFIVGTTLGAVIILIAPWLSKRVSAMRQGKIIRFQGLLITFLLLIVAASILQVVR